MIWNRPCSTPLRRVGGELEAAGGGVALDERIEAGSWMGTSPWLSRSIFFESTSTHDDMIAGLGEAGTGDEAHVAGAEDSYAHLEDIFSGRFGRKD